MLKSGQQHVMLCQPNKHKISSHDRWSRGKLLAAKAPTATTAIPVMDMKQNMTGLQQFHGVES